MLAQSRSQALRLRVAICLSDLHGGGVCQSAQGLQAPRQPSSEAHVLAGEPERAASAAAREVHVHAQLGGRLPDGAQSCGVQHDVSRAGDGQPHSADFKQQTADQRVRLAPERQLQAASYSIAGAHVADGATETRRVSAGSAQRGGPVPEAADAIACEVRGADAAEADRPQRSVDPSSQVQ